MQKKVQLALIALTILITILTYYFYFQGISPSLSPLKNSISRETPIINNNLKNKETQNTLQDHDLCKICTSDSSCNQNQKCTNGCCQSLTCKDSDGGINPEESGLISFCESTPNGEICTSGGPADHCQNLQNLTEYFCEGNEVKNTSIECDSDELCENGKCIDKRRAQFLTVPLPDNLHCFRSEFESNPECAPFWVEICSEFSCSNWPACPRYYNPVYDESGTFYPSHCWAEKLGEGNFNYGYSYELTDFIKSLWFTKVESSDRKYEVPSPNIGFTYNGGVRLRSSIWTSNLKLKYLDYNIYTTEGFTQESTAFRSKDQTFPPHSYNRKGLLVHINFDDAYPEEILENYPSVFNQHINDYFSKKQEVPNPVRYDIQTVIITPPEGISKEDNPYTEEQHQAIFNAATAITGTTNYDTLIISPIIINGYGGYYTNWNNMQIIYAPLTPWVEYSNESVVNGTNAMALYQATFATISHEVLHELGLPGDHGLMGYGTRYLNFYGQNTDPVTGHYRDPPTTRCDFYGNNDEFYAIEMPIEIQIQVGQEPIDFTKTESASGPCLSGLNNNAMLKDMDQDGTYEMVYSNNLIGRELQEFLGWIDIDRDGISEIIDPEPYGGLKEHIYDSITDDDVLIMENPSTFTYHGIWIVKDCLFFKVELENGFIGLVPKSCREYNGEIVNIYEDVKYLWEPANYSIITGEPQNTSYGMVVFPRFLGH